MLEFLSQSQKGNFLDLTIAYAKHQKDPEIKCKKVLNVFNFIRGRLDVQIEKAKIKAEIARKNGASGGRPTKPKKVKKSKLEISIEGINEAAINQNQFKPEDKKEILFEPTEMETEIAVAAKKLSDTLFKKRGIVPNSKSWIECVSAIKSLKESLINDKNLQSDLLNAIQTIETDHDQTYFPQVYSGVDFQDKFFKIKSYSDRKNKGNTSKHTNFEQQDYHAGVNADGSF